MNLWWRYKRTQKHNLISDKQKKIDGYVDNKKSKFHFKWYEWEAVGGGKKRQNMDRH